MVLVQIPQNNFNNQKTILGRIEDLEAQSKAYNFAFPFDKFVPLKQLTNVLPPIDMHYHANDPDDGNSLLYDKEYFNNAYLNHNLIYAFENNGTTALFGSTLGIKVDVQTLLHGYDVEEGNYGFQILVKGIRKDVDGETTQGATDVYYFTNDNMYGNPYNYLLPMEQQILIDVSAYMTIEAIYVAFWQAFTQAEDGTYNGSFKDSLGELIPYVDNTLEGTGLSEIPPNLIFENLEVYLGITTDEVDKDTLFIYTYDDMKYGKDTNLPGDRSQYDKKTVYLTWVRLSDDLKSTNAIDTTEKLKEQKARVYWYEHDSDWHPDNEDYDENIDSHRFGGLYWRPLMHFEDSMNIEIIPDIKKSHARYKAVVHYDGNYITSDIITFNNAIDVEGLAEDLARNDKYILRISTYTEDPKNKGQKTLVPNDALGNFYVYDENNNVLANDDAIPFSKVEYYLEVWVKSSVDENGTPIYTRLSDFTEMIEEEGVDKEIFAPFLIDWKFPTELSMIASQEEIKREDAYFSQRTDEQFERDKITTRKFKIKSIYNMRYNDNDINAVLERNGQTFTLTKQLLFGQASAFGCEFVPVINITNPSGNFYVATNSQYTLQCLIYDRRCELFEEDKRADCQFEWKIYTENGEQRYTSTGNSDGFAGNVITGTTAVPMVVEVTVTGAADYPITVRRGIMICNSPAFMQKYDILCPDRVEFRSDGQNPKYYTGKFMVKTINLDEDDRYVYPNWTINKTYNLALKHTTVPAQTITQPDGEIVSYDEHIETQLIMGSVRTQNAITNRYSYQQQWTDALLDTHNFTYIGFTYEGATVQQAIAFDQNAYASSLVNEWDGQSLSLDYENSAVIGKMFAAGTKDSRNRFTGVMMGDWSSKADESLDNPGIYGFKAGLQTFGFKQDGTGFIGPSGRGRIQFDGRNALISNSDRSCYINLNPIQVLSYWDEDKKVFTKQDIPALVNESGFSQYFLYCKVPQVVDTSDIDNLAKFSEEDSSYINTTWAKKFIDPKETDPNYGYDFFLVDPSLGVVASGGIYARYGVLGKKYPWIISDSGLTQKNFYGTIFLGNPEYVSKDYNTKSRFNYSHLEDIEPTFTIKQDEEAEPVHGMYSMVFTDNLSRIRTGVRADGYLYTEYATIGNWHINDYEMFVPSRNIDAKEEFEFRKEYRKTKKLDNGAPSYTLDSMNLNSYGSFIAFDQGRLLIDGKNGLMGFTKRDRDNPDGNYFTEDVYTMLIHLEDGTINFAKTKDEKDPRAQIDGIEGIAYFAKKNIVLSGENATMYLGSPVTIKGETVSEQTQGTIYLGQIKLWGISANDAGSDALVTVPSISAGGSGNIDVSSTNTSILPFDFEMSDTVDESTGSYSGGYLSHWNPDPYTIITYSESGGGTINSAGVYYVGYVRDQFTIKDMSTSLIGGGLNIGVGGDAVILRPAGTTSVGYLIGEWNLNAKEIKAEKIIMDEGYIKYETDYVAIASQLWVYKAVAEPLWSRVVEVNNLAATALEKAYQGISLANKAINTAIVDIGLESLTLGASTGINVKWTTKGGSSGSSSMTGTAVASVKHVHKIKGEMTGASLQLDCGEPTIGGNTTISLAPIAEGASMTINGSGGTFDITLSMLSRNIKSNSFNIADTQYYKDALEVSAISFDESTKTITITNKNGDTIKASATDAYNAGWASAASGCGRSGNTVTYPTSTVGKKASDTAHWYDTHSAGVSKTYKTVTAADVGTQVIDSAEGVLYGTSHFYWT